MIDVMGFFTVEEIRKYFSFLYKELSALGKPYLNKEDVEEIFKNGFTIPEIPMEIKYKLNLNKKYTRSIVDFSIQQFYRYHSRTHKDKKNYLRFFGSYLEDYWAALESESQLHLLASNFSNKKPKLNTINWESYLPERFINKS